MAANIALPFTTIDGLFTVGFDNFLNVTLLNVETFIGPPTLACVTVWIIIQGVLIMRGDIDTRNGITKLIMVAIVVGLATNQALYQEYVVDFFIYSVPTVVQQISNILPGPGLPVIGIPPSLDLVFDTGEAMFQKVGEQIGPMNAQDTLAFEGAQWAFYFSLWSIFTIYDTVMIMTRVLVAIGPLVLIGYLFDSTRQIAEKWIGQLITYALLLLLVDVVASVVVAIMFLGLGLNFIVTAATGTTDAEIIGLYELDMFFLAGNAIVVALPTIAASLGGGVSSDDNGWRLQFARRSTSVSGTAGRSSAAKTGAQARG